MIHLIYIVTAGIFRLLLFKRSYTLYIGILFTINLSAQTRMDTISFTMKGQFSVFQYIESFKDSLIIDSTIRNMRYSIPICKSEHGGTFDIYTCEMQLGTFRRIHSYGSRMGIKTFDNDYYYLNDELIGSVTVSFLESKSPETQIILYIWTKE